MIAKATCGTDTISMFDMALIGEGGTERGTVVAEDRKGHNSNTPPQTEAIVV